MNGRMAKRIRAEALEDFSRRGGRSLKTAYRSFNATGQIIVDPRCYRGVYHEHKRRHA